MNVKTAIAFTAAFVCLVVCAGEAAWDIGSAMAEAAFWDSDPMLLMSEHGKRGFAFTSGEKKAADCRRAGAVKCFGFEAFETVLRFGEEKGIDAVEISFYNNGGVEKVEEVELGDGRRMRHGSRDDRTITRDEFLAIGRDVVAKLTPKGSKPPKAVNGAMRTAEMEVKEMAWKKSTLGGSAKLTWSYTQKGRNTASFKPGYIKLAVVRPGAAPIGESAGAKVSTAKAAAKITDNILRDSRGTFLDNIPMVDQGMKGYCAAATSERVLKYYGVDVDEHEIAQLAGTTAAGGTSTRELKNSVEKIGKKYRLATVTCYGDFNDDVGTRIAGLNKEVENYNKAAKKLKAAEITQDMYVSREGNMINYDLAAVDKAMEPRVLVEMKTHGAQAAGYKNFLKNIHAQIDKGIPLFWGVKLGVAAEPEIPQQMGYHMRLIIGYNDKKNEVIYSDSWGAGHEFKKMRADWAWTITKSLIYMKPL